MTGGDLSGRVSVQRGSLQGPRETPQYGNERAVRILLECILVLKNSSQKIPAKQYLFIVSWYFHTDRDQ